jgi:DNA-directed RNA polymerase omega subunit
MSYTPKDDLIKDDKTSIFKLTVLAARRAGELNQGSAKLIDTGRATKLTSVALGEIGQGKVRYEENGNGKKARKKK